MANQNYCQNTGWNDKIVALEKTTWFHFRLMKTGFLFFFFVADHLLVGQLCSKPKSDRSLLLCLKVTQCSTSETRKCAAIQLMLSTDPSYDNRTIASTLKMQTRTVQRAQGDENKVSGYGYGLWCGFKCGPHHATWHVRSRLEGQRQSVPGCAEECGDPPGSIRWPVVDRECGSTTRRRPTSKETQAWLQKECYDFVPLLHWPSSPPTWTRWTTSFGHMSRTSPT